MLSPYLTKQGIDCNMLLNVRTSYAYYYYFSGDIEQGRALRAACAEALN
jgi:hypothetical protein